MRDEGGSGGDWVNKGIIILCVLIFLATLPIHDYVVGNFGVVPVEVAAGASLLTLLTSMFLHGGFVHLLGNMWYLWIFGDNVERSMGHARYAAFYLLVGLAGSLAHIASDPTSTIPTIGASGAISGVLGAYLLLHPHNRIDAITTMGVLAHVQINAKWVIGAWFVIQLFFSGFSLLGAETGVAYLAHVGGFVAGYALARLFVKRV
ncbi:MAG: rhomboid family intramembrane serine protease [Candidatus Aenigmatarchaeota archaeon]|nr:MAG: rhomboid family intramembrane serine protease [Candidatus Aenigmarchaeota archaeon]